MAVSIGFVSTRERSGAVQKLTVALREAITCDKCWIMCDSRELAAAVVSQLVLKGRVFDVVINQPCTLRPIG